MWKAVEERISGPVIFEKEVRIRIGVNQNWTSNLGILLQMRWQPKKKSLSSRPSGSLRPQTLYKFSGLSWCTGTRENSYCFHIHTWSCDAFVNVSFLCVPVHEDTTKFSASSMSSYWRTELYLIHLFLDKVRKRSVFKHTSGIKDPAIYKKNNTSYWRYPNDTKMISTTLRSLHQPRVQGHSGMIGRSTYTRPLTTQP